MLYPKGYDATSNKKYPIIIVLHGLGEGGRRGLDPRFPAYSTSDPRYLNNDHQLFHGGRQHLAAVNRNPADSRAFPGFVIFPQNNVFWAGNDQDNVISLLDAVLKIYPIDVNRVYLHGYSAGGGGVWRIAEKRPDLFAAILPMSSVHSGIDASKIVHLPIWHFQGGFDENPTAQSAQALQQKLVAAGATPRYYEYVNGGHGIWDKAYAEPDFFSWMLGKHKTDIHTYYGKTEVCPGESVNIRLGVSVGFSVYQWKREVNGEETILATSTNNELTADTYGKYFVRFSRVENPRSEDWTPWSKPVTIKEKALTATPTIEATNTTLPTPGGIKKAELVVADSFATYRWFKDGILLDGAAFSESIISVGEPGSYTVSVTEAGGCNSLLSAPVIVTYNGSESEINQPKDLVATSLSETEIALQWKDDAANETGYEIYRSTESGTNFKFVKKTQKDITQFNDQNLDAGQAYYYIIRGVNNFGSSPYSNEATATTLDDVLVPSTPQNLRYFTESTQTIVLTWQASTDNVGVEEYQIYVNGVLSATTKGTSFSMENLEPNQAFTIYIVARDKSGNASMPGNQITAYTVFEGLAYKYYEAGIWEKISDYENWAVAKQGFIENFNIGTEAEGGVRPNAQISYFAFDFSGFLYIEREGNYQFSLRAAAGSILTIDGRVIANNDGMHGDSTVTSTTRFYAKGAHPIFIQFYDRVEDEVLQVRYAGPDTNEDMILIPDGTLRSGEKQSSGAPLAPSEFVAKTISESQIDLSWQDNATDETAFEIYRASNLASDFEKIMSVDADVTAYADKAVLPNSLYFYQLKAINNAGSSEPVMDTATTALLPAILNFSGNTAEETVQLTWVTTKEVFADSFKVERATGGSFQSIGKLKAVGSSMEETAYQYPDEIPIKGTNLYRLKQTDLAGNSIYSETIAVEFPSKGMAISAEIYPIPALTQELYIKLNLTNQIDLVNLQIVDSFGRLWHLKSLSPAQLRRPYNLLAHTTLGKGLFLILIEQGGQQIKKKFIVDY